MPFIYVFGIVAVSAYLLQGFLGFYKLNTLRKFMVKCAAKDVSRLDVNRVNLKRERLS